MIVPKKALLLIIIGFVFSNLVVYFAVTASFKNKIAHYESQITNIEKDIYIEEILQELEKETIHSTDEQNAYDKISERQDKSFLYDSRGMVLIKNSEIYFNDFKDPLDVNQYYQDIIDKFINLYKQHEEMITVDDLAQAGFMPEVKDYGIKSIYPDAQQNYKALSKYYMNKRIMLELEIEKFMNGRSSIEQIKEKYSGYESAKKMLKNYIDGITPGDI